jgi:hypothetical protein
LRGEYKLKVSENIEQRNVFRPENDEVNNLKHYEGVSRRFRTESITK